MRRTNGAKYGKTTDLHVVFFISRSYMHWLEAVRTRILPVVTKNADDKFPRGGGGDRGILSDCHLLPPTVQYTSVYNKICCKQVVDVYSLTVLGLGNRQ